MDILGQADPPVPAATTRSTTLAAWLSPLVMLIGIIAAAIAALIVPVASMEAFIVENGPAQAATALIWFVLAAALLVQSLRSGSPAFILALLAAIAGLREMDGHVIFTSGSITKTSYWVDGTVALQEKALAGLALALIIGLVVYGIRRHSAGLWHLLKTGDPAAWSLATVALTIPATMIIDGVPRYYRDITGVRMEASMAIISVAIEEIGEMIMPVVGLIGLGQYSQRDAETG